MTVCLEKGILFSHLGDIAMDTNLWVVKIAWSQTDHENVLLNATSRDQAELKAMQQFGGAHHVVSVSKINHDCTGYT